MVMTSFSKRDKIILTALLILLLGILYYRFIHIGLNKTLDVFETEADQLQTEVEMANARLARINKMKDEMAAPNLSRMGSYNNSKPETAFLHTVLSSTPNYSLTFSGLTRNGNQVRRNFNLRFTTSSYAEAVKVIQSLTEGEFRCLLGDMSCSIADGGQTTMTVNGTFYETMVGGMEDSALPPDANNQQTSSE